MEAAASKQLDKGTEARECIVCMVNDANSRAALCQHWYLCMDCALKVDKCPVCRRKSFPSTAAPPLLSADEFDLMLVLHPPEESRPNDDSYFLGRIDPPPALNVRVRPYNRNNAT